jgi:hypothetical protein
MPTLSLDAIQQRIAERDSELQALHRELGSRRSRLQALTQRKEALQAKLQHVEAEMAAVAAGVKRPQTVSPKSAPKKQSPKSPPAGKPSPPSLPALLVAAIRAAGGPLTAKQLVSEVKRRGFKSSSAHFTKMVEARLWDLKKQGVVQRAPDQPGYTLALSSKGPTPTAGAAKSAGSKASPRGQAKPAPSKASAARTAQPASGGRAANRLPLHVVLTQILKKRGTPVTGSALAEEALKAGYQTTSHNFAQTVWTALGTMKNVENVKGQGYRLKRNK